MRRTRRLLTGLGLGVGVLGALAAALPWVVPATGTEVLLTVSPPQAAPDQHLTLTAHGCPVPALASSNAFDSVLLASDGQPRTLRLDTAVAPGHYRILLDCNGATAAATLWVVAPAAPQSR